MTFRLNTRRVLTTWSRAAELARSWGWQTRWKHRVRKVPGGYMAVRTDRRVVTPITESDWARCLRRTGT